MKTINGRSYPGTLKGKFHTLRQMKNFLRSSKELNKEYWQARIDEFKIDAIKLKAFFKKRNKK